MDNPKKIALFRCEQACKIDKCSRRCATPEKEKFWTCEDRVFCGIRFEEDFNKMDNAKSCNNCLFSVLWRSNICPSKCEDGNMWTDASEIGTWVKHVSEM